MSSINVNSTNNTITARTDDSISSASSSTEHALKTGVTWNGDINYSSLGNDFESALLALDQKMVTPQSCIRAATLDASTRELLDSLFDKVIVQVRSKSDQERATAFGLLFRYLFYVRSIRVAGKKSRLLFYYLFERLYTIFPKTCLALISLVPEFGYFGDLDQLMVKMSDHPDVVRAAENVYLEYINKDCILLWGKPLNKVTKDDAVSLNEKIKILTRVELRAFVGNKGLSLAAKWFKREGKKDSGHRKEFIVGVYFPNGGITDLETSKDPVARDLAKRRLAYCQMVFRNVISALSQCVLVGESMMCDDDYTHRTWSDIALEFAPAGFMTKYRKALANEKLDEVPTESQLETGNRFVNRPDRIECRKNLLQALINDKVKGASQDVDRLSKLIYKNLSKVVFNTISPIERQVISAQWRDLVSKIKDDIDKIIEASRTEAIESGDTWFDPRNVIPVIDTSGSMTSFGVQDKAIGLGILASYLSAMPGCLISFSMQPELYHLDLSGKSDVFDHFLTIANGPTGLSTNIDATYRLVLHLMISSGRTGVNDTDFALLFLTDGQFDELVELPPNRDRRAYKVPDTRPVSYHFEQTFIERMEAEFNSNGFNLPRTVFWNLTAESPGFPATSISRGVQLVSGYSQTLMLQVFTGDYKYEVQTDGSVKVNVSPWESFLKALLHQGYDQVSQIVASVGEDCLTHLDKVD